MTDKKWDDRKIDDLLGSVPDIKDNRPKSDILMRLKQDERLQNSQRKKRNNWIPAFVAVAALFVLSILIPSVLRNGEDSSMDISADKQITNEAKMDVSPRSADMKQSTEQEESAGKSGDHRAVEAFSSDAESVHRFAVYPSELGNGTVFHMGLAGDAAASVPVTFLIPDAQIREDFGSVEPNSLELYKMYGARIDEEALGFSDYHPYKGTFKVEGKTIIHSLPIEHGYDTASASFGIYEHSLQDTFYGFKEIRFENEDGSVMEFDQVGAPSKPLLLKNSEKSQNYYLVEQNNGMQFLSSNFGKTYKSLEEALRDMKSKPNDIYSPVIPEDINFEIIQDAGFTIVKFKDRLDLESLDSTKAMQMVEGILLTGASFGEQLQFENVVQTEWNGFDFSKKLPIPVGANSQPFILK